MTRLFFVEQNTLAIGGHYYSYTKCIAQSAVDAGFRVTILQNTRNGQAWNISGVECINAFTRTWNEAERQGISDWGVGNVAYEYVNAVAADPPSVEDHVLILTLSISELAMFLSYIVNVAPGEGLPHFHFLLRYDSNLIAENFEILRQYLNFIRNSYSLKTRVHFYSDTVLLSEDYESLTRIPFRTLPIPFDQAVLREDRSKSRKSGSRLRITYLGDARLEKNFHWIPAAVEALYRDSELKEKVQFHLQCNFNDQKGELFQLSARQRLAQYPKEFVKLYEKPMQTVDYYEILAGADIVLIPYSPINYRARSSGILVEAMAAGKPVITSKGSWMATMTSENAALLIEGPNDFVAKLKLMATDHDRFSRGAAEQAPRMLDWSCGANFLAELMRPFREEPVQQKFGPTVLVVFDGDAAVLRNGAYRIFENQIECIQSAGYRVVALFLTRGESLEDKGIEGYARVLKQAVSHLPLQNYFLAAPGRLSLDSNTWSAERLREAQTIATDLALAYRYDFPAELFRDLNKYPPSAIFLNYVTNIGVIESIGLSSTPVICEMHDIQSFQKAIYSARPVSEADIELEKRLLKKCDAIISLNEQETSIVREWDPNVDIVTTGVVLAGGTLRASALAGAVDLTDLINAAGPENPVRSISQPEGREFVSTSIDLLFVGSNHLPNVLGLRWFLDEVFYPFLAPEGVTMVVAGSVCKTLDWSSSTNLLPLGSVNDLDPLYSAAKIVVLPILEGAGSPVKTFEAIRHARPVVATRHAVRGIEPIPAGVGVADDPESFAEKVLALLTDETLWRAEAELLAKPGQRRAEWDRYRKTIDDVFSRVLGDEALKSQTSDFEEIATVEWSPLLQAVNCIVWALLDRTKIAEAALQILRAASLEQVVEVATPILTSLFVRRDALLLTTDKALARKIAGVRQAPKRTVREIMSLLELANASVLRERVELTGVGESVCWVVASAEADLEVRAVMERESSTLRCIDITGSGEATRSSTGFDGFWRFEIDRSERTATGRFILGFYRASSSAGAAPEVSLVQKFAATDVLSGEAVTRSNEVGVSIWAGSPFSLRIPNLVSSFQSTLIAELRFARQHVDVVSSVAIEGVPISHTISLHGDQVALRFEVPSRFRMDPLSPLVSEIYMHAIDGAQCFRITSLVVGLFPAPRAGESLTAPFGFDNDKTLADASLKFIQRAAEILRHGKGLSASLARRLTVTNPLAPVVYSTSVAGKPDSFGTATLTKLLARPVLISPRLRVDVYAEFKPALVREKVTCTIGHRAAAFNELTPEKILHFNRRPLVEFNIGDWDGQLIFKTENGFTVEPSLVKHEIFGILGRDWGENDSPIQSAGFYAIEYVDGCPSEVSHRWTGPCRFFCIRFPISATPDMRIELKVANFGLNQADSDFLVFANGVFHAPEIERLGSHGKLVIKLSADVAPAACVDLGILVRRWFQPEAEGRVLGIALGDIMVSWTKVSVSTPVSPKLGRFRS